MSFSDPIADFLTRIRNGQKNFFDSVKVRNSNQIRSILKVLKEEGYIKDFDNSQVSSSSYEISVNLKYSDGRPVIQFIKRMSKPGRRLYSSISKLPKLRNGLGITILSTSKGVMTDAEARRVNLGGEILCQVF